MSFPMPALDDRTFQDFVDEAKRRIPLHTPEWTDHNVSDPGVALIELFAWMSESIIYRLNQVPDRLYRSFLDLVGVAPFVPRSASTPVTFWIRPADTAEHSVEVGTRVSTTQDTDGGSVEFMVTSPVTIRQPELIAALTGFELPPAADLESPESSDTETDTQLSVSQRGGLQIRQLFRDRGGRREFKDIAFPSVDSKPPGERALFEPDNNVVCFAQTFEGGVAPDPSHDQAVYFGFKKSLAGNVLNLDIDGPAAADYQGPGTDGVGIDPDHPPLVWEVSTGIDAKSRCLWERAEIDTGGDSTSGLLVKGRVLLYLPFEHTEELRGEQRCYWLRVRLESADSSYTKSPEISSIRFRSLGGRAPAEQGYAVQREELGVSTGEPAQQFSVLRTPVLPRHRTTLGQSGDRIEDVLGDGTTRERDETHDYVETLESVLPNGVTRIWEEVPNFANSTRRQRHFTWDSATGEIKLGPAVRGADGSIQQRGLVPEAGTRFAVTGYRCGGGSIGNVPKDSIVVDRSGHDWVQRVNNRTATSGGVDAETVENAKIRGPLTLVTGDRAVTTDDYERLTMSHHRRVGRARCLPAHETGEPITMGIVCIPDGPIEQATQADFMADVELLANIEQTLDARRLMGVKLAFGPAEFRGVSIACSVVAHDGYSGHTIRALCIEKLTQNISPLGASPDNEGWAWGTNIDFGAVRAILQEVEGVHTVRHVLFFNADYSPESGYSKAARTGVKMDTFVLPKLGLPVSFDHQVLVESLSQALQRAGRPRP